MQSLKREYIQLEDVSSIDEKSTTKTTKTKTIKTIESHIFLLISLQLPSTTTTTTTEDNKKTTQHSNNSLIHKQFVAKLRSFRIFILPNNGTAQSKSIGSDALRCGLYDGVVALLAALSGPLLEESEAQVDDKDTGSLTELDETSPIMCEKTMLCTICELLINFCRTNSNSYCRTLVESEDYQSSDCNDGSRGHTSRASGSGVGDLTKKGGRGVLNIGDCSSNSQQRRELSDKTMLLRWDLLSFEAVVQSVRLLTNLFTRFPHAFVTRLDPKHSIGLMYALGSLLRLDAGDRKRHSSEIRLCNGNTNGDNGNSYTNSSHNSKNDKENRTSTDAGDHMSIETLRRGIVKIMCLPFALDLEQTVLFEIMCSLHQSEALKFLLETNMDQSISR